MRKAFQKRKAGAPSLRELSSERETEGVCTLKKWIPYKAPQTPSVTLSPRTPKAHFIHFGEPLPRDTFLTEEGCGSPKKGSPKKKRDAQGIALFVN